VALTIVIALDCALYRGRFGFDDGYKPCGACRDDSESRKSKAVIE
jgi:hypothetical protein